MLLICKDCGTIVNDESCITKRERIGEYWGVPVTVTNYYCPDCESDDLSEYEESEEEEE